MAEISDYLQEFEEQKVQENKDIVVVKNPILTVLLEKYEQWLSEKEWYDDAGHLVRTLKYTAKDVKDFSLLLKKYESNEWFNWSGNFLSALINTSSEKNFEIITEHLTNRIDCIGFQNVKNVTVIGSVGEQIGQEMREGTILVQGDTGSHTGFLMKGGKIIVKGNAGDVIGGQIGLHSQGGEIHIYGHHKSVGEPCLAKIYHKGELIWPR